MRRISILLGLLLLSLSAAAQDKFSDITIKIVKDENGKPVRNATVVLHPLDSKGKEQGSLGLKTDSDGKSVYNNMPYGKLRIQVIAHGRKTFGQDFEINQPDQEINIKLKPPADQYSIYKDAPQDKAPEKQN